MIKVEPVPAFNDNYIWLIIQTGNDYVAIVDPGDAAPVMDKLNAENLKPEAILITHHHMDHTGGINGLLQHFDVPVYGPKHEHVPGCTHELVEGDTVRLDQISIDFRIFELPGHTSGAIAYYGNEMVFVGDTLFMSGCGRLFEGTPAQMHQSLGKISSLPDDTLVYCAHEYTLANLKFAEAVEPGNQDIQKRIEKTRSLRNENIPTVPGKIGIEKLTNPFLRTHINEVREAANNFSKRNLTGEIEVFAAIRSWKDNF